MKISKHVRTFGFTAGNASCCSMDRLTRRGFMSGSAALAAASLGGTALPRQVLAAAKKSPKKLVKYQTSPKNGHHCSQCTFFQPASKTCKVVAGSIDPNGWCLRWAKK